MNPNLYKTIFINSISEIVIEKSKFITNMVKVKNEEEVQSFFSQIKKQYWDATHNCTAYITYSGSMRSNDDGEPSGTAGKPILECLKKNELYDVAVVVTRYFGGIKLGSGGLIRAYSSATQNGIKHSGVIERILHKSLILKLNYSFWDRIEKFIKNKNISFLKPDFSEIVSIKIFVLNEVEIIEEVTNMCNGNLEFELGESEFIEVLLHKPN